MGHRLSLLCLCILVASALTGALAAGTSQAAGCSGDYCTVLTPFADPAIYAAGLQIIPPGPPGTPPAVPGPA